MQKVAIITGASSGLGQSFALNVKRYFDIDELWLIARREDRLVQLSKELPIATKVITLDLADTACIQRYMDILNKQKPNVTLLINNAGLGYYGEFIDMSVQKIYSMVDVNIRALTAVTNATLPYMAAGGRILNVSSIASFVPNAYMSVYSSTKAYVTSFSRAVRYELKGRKIKVTAVCPGPMATEFEKVGEVTSKRFNRLPFCKVESVVKGSLKAVKRGKLIYTNRLIYKFYRLLAKVLPLAWLVPIAKC